MIDPLRTFDLSEDDWREVNEGVEEEGFDDWDGYAPAIVAAIEKGYLDRHLQMLGRFMRERYQHLKTNEPDTVLALYTPGVQGRAVVGKTAIDKLLEDNPGMYDMLPEHGVRPVRKGGSYSAHEFVYKDFIFRKADFVGKHFTSPVPVDGGALYVIDKVASINFQVRVVGVNSERQKGKIGRTYNFAIANQRVGKWYNLPADA